MKTIALMLWISFLGCHKTSPDTPLSSPATEAGDATAKQSILASTLIVEAQSISESTTSTSTDSQPNAATDQTDNSQTGTKISSSVAAYSNQLDFFRVPTVASTDSSLAGNPIRDYRDYTDLAIGPDATCVITGTTGNVVCPSYVSFILFTDPWKKNPYVPGSLTIGNNHACAKSTLDSTYYCWGYWTNTTTADGTSFWDSALSFSTHLPIVGDLINGFIGGDTTNNESSTLPNVGTDGQPFWDSTISCTDNLFQYVNAIDGDTIYYKSGTFPFCKASRKAKGTQFLSSGDIDCEIVNNTPICIGPVNPYTSNTVTTLYRSTIFSNLQNTTTNSCVLHDDLSVTCSNSASGPITNSCVPDGLFSTSCSSSHPRTFSAYKPIWGTSNIYASQVAVGENMGCAYVSRTIDNTKPISQLGCWKLPSTTMVPLQNSIGYGGIAGTIKVVQNLVCAQQGTRVRCWSPTQGDEYMNIPFPSVVSTFSVGNGYVCTLDQEGKSGCWLADSGTPLNNNRKP